MRRAEKEIRSGERLLRKSITCRLIADKDNGTGIAPLRETARKLPGRNEVPAV
jgi:hypothetical protein